jgi:coatomer subunit beta
VRSCLEHRHSYVRKNAVFAVYSIYRQFENLIPDAPELVQTFLAAESDSMCKRNAFLFLANCAMPKAVEYVMQVYEQIPSLDEALQMSIIEVIQMDCKADSSHKVRASLGRASHAVLKLGNQGRYIKCVLELLNTSSNAVRYEAATLLTTLTQNAAAIKAAASCYVNLAVKESDNNVKLIVLDRLETLRSKHASAVDSLILDILQVLSA